MIILPKEAGRTLYNETAFHYTDYLNEQKAIGWHSN
jgi:hypothetical protein